jgi:hypothetical protein
LNQKPDDAEAQDEFIERANEVSRKLSERYGKQWVNPNQDAPHVAYLKEDSPS